MKILFGFTEFRTQFFSGMANKQVISYLEWDSMPGDGVPFPTHRSSFLDTLVAASMQFKPEQIVGPQIIVVGDTAAMLLSSLPQTHLASCNEDGSLRSANVKNEPNLYVLGRIARWKVFYDVSPEMEDKMLVSSVAQNGDENMVEVTITGTGVVGRPKSAPEPVQA